MSKAIQKSVVLCLMAMWTLFFAVHAAEAFGYFEDTLEHSEESVEKTFSSPLEATSHYSLTEHLSKIILSFEGGNCLQKSFPILGFYSLPYWNSFLDESPPSTSLKLFQLFSVYRI